MAFSWQSSSLPPAGNPLQLQIWPLLIWCCAPCGRVAGRWKLQVHAARCLMPGLCTKTLNADAGHRQALEQHIAAAAGDFKSAHIAETLWGFGTLRHVPAPATLALLLQGVLESEVS